MWSAPRLFCAARILAETRRTGRENRLHLDGCCKPMCKNGAAEAKLYAAEKQVTGGAKRAKPARPAPAACIKARRPPAAGGFYARRAQSMASKTECILYSRNEYLIIFASAPFPQGGACVSPVTKGGRARAAQAFAAARGGLWYDARRANAHGGPPGPARRRGFGMSAARSARPAAVPGAENFIIYDGKLHGFRRAFVTLFIQL